MNFTVIGTVGRADVGDLFAIERQQSPDLTYQQYLRKHGMSGLRVEFDAPVQAGDQTFISTKIPADALPDTEISVGHRVMVGLTAKQGQLAVVEMQVDPTSTPLRYPPTLGQERPVDIDGIAEGDVIRYFLETATSFEGGYAVKSRNHLGEAIFVPLDGNDCPDPRQENISLDLLRTAAKRGELVLVSAYVPDRGLPATAVADTGAPTRPSGGLRALALTVARRLQS